MSKINRYKLSKGVKLLPDHLNSSIGDATSVLSSAAINADQMKNNKNAFYINLNIPVIRSSWGEVIGEADTLETPFPFILPPLQDEFSMDFHTSEKKITLTELMLSFDQNANALAMIDYFDKTRMPGVLFDGGASAFNIRLKLYEKTPMKVGTTGTTECSLTPEKVIYQADFSSALFISVKYRNNPYVIGNLNLQIDPYKTYILTISFPQSLTQSFSIGGAPEQKNVMLPSTNIRMKFQSKLLNPDSFATLGGVDVQNAPIEHSLFNEFPPVMDVPVWNAGDKIVANEVGITYGIQTRLEKIDYQLVKGLKGGLDKSSDTRPEATINSMYGYDVICVPMFQTLEAIRRGMIGGTKTDFLPYVDSTITNPEWMLDRRIINISFPFVIHHIFCSVSFFANQSSMLYVGANKPALITGGPGTYRQSDDMKRELGVFIGTGIRADHYDIQQIAYNQFNNANIDSMVDKIQLADHKSNPALFGSVGTNWLRGNAADTELWQVPLNYGSSRTGYGFEENGAPFFVGNGDRITYRRNNVYDRPFDFGGAAASVVPNTRGAEQWIEVRSKISLTGGLKYELPDESIDTDWQKYNDIVLGRGGMMVYIIGKRALT